MKNKFFSFSLFIVLISPIAFAEERLILAVDGQWPPYNFETNEELSGLDILLAREIFEEAGLLLDIKILPNKRAMENLKSGNVDILCGASFTDERNEFSYYSIPYRFEKLGIMIRKGTAVKWPIERLIDISNYPNLILSAGRGGWYGPQYQEVLDDPEASKHLYLTNDISSRLQMLSLSRVDMVIGDINALLWNSAQLNLADALELHSLTLSSEPIHFMFSKISVSTEIVHSVNDAIESLSENGTMERMNNDFINSNQSD